MTLLHRSKKALGLASIIFVSACASLSSNAEKAAPVYKFTKEEIAGKIFSTDRAVEDHSFGAKGYNVDSMGSSDEKFYTGMYKTGPVVEDHTKKPYGVDEFMYFITGGVTLTSIDGTVTEVKAGEAISMPKEWMGTWKSEGYTKLWVIYSSKGFEE